MLSNCNSTINRLFEVQIVSSSLDIVPDNAKLAKSYSNMWTSTDTPAPCYHRIYINLQSKPPHLFSHIVRCMDANLPRYPKNPDTRSSSPPRPPPPSMHVDAHMYARVQAIHIHLSPCLPLHGCQCPGSCCHGPCAVLPAEGSGQSHSQYPPPGAVWGWRTCSQMRSVSQWAMS